jgi:hypothetical protein
MKKSREDLKTWEEIKREEEMQKEKEKRKTIKAIRRLTIKHKKETRQIDFEESWPLASY